VIILASGMVVSAWLSNPERQMQARRATLFQEPVPVPVWLVTYAPTATQVLSVKDAVFGTGEDPFWPGAGVVCVQIDGNATHITTLDEPRSKVVLSLNGEPIREASSGQLRLGTHDIKGFIFPSFAKRIPGVNVCWRMILDPGEYIATLQLSQDSGTTLKYEWAFRLTE